MSLESLKLGRLGRAPPCAPATPVLSLQLGNPVINSLDATNLQWVRELLRAYNKGMHVTSSIHGATLTGESMAWGDHDVGGAR